MYKTHESMPVMIPFMESYGFLLVMRFHVESHESLVNVRGKFSTENFCKKAVVLPYF